MEIRINKEIKEYHESLFFGLSFRQFLCGGLAVGAAVGIYFGLGQILGRETTSWLCILCAAPIAAAGFFKFNGMKLEELSPLGCGVNSSARENESSNRKI